MTNIRPLHDYVLVEPDGSEDDEQRTASGIITGFMSKQRMAGTVLSVGPGALQRDGTRKSLGVEVGDKVLIGSKAGEPLKRDGKEYRIVKMSEVMGVLTERVFESEE